MFTGIIAKKAKIISNSMKNGSCFLSIQKPSGWKLKEGESVSTDGVCLTVKKINSKNYEVELMQETLKKTTFGKYVPAHVNLERSLRVGDDLSGHFVTGHVDTIGKIKNITIDGMAKIYTISFAKSFQKLIVKKGSICVDGISLTVTDVKPGLFSVAILPYTIEGTTIGEKTKGMDVNLEFDILAKYIINK